MRVLIAEDDPVIALGLAERLRALGHEPIGPAGDGEQAVALARTSRPDLYLFDIEMPNVDGLAAAAQLAGEGLRRPVVVVTGVEDPGLVERSIASGVSAYLTKPIDARELDAAIKLAAARHAEFEALEAEVERAQQALEDRKLVERAKGLLMAALKLSEHDAFRRLQTDRTRAQPATRRRRTPDRRAGEPPQAQGCFTGLTSRHGRSAMAVSQLSYTAAVGAAALSMLVPGLGQLVVGAYRRGLVLLSLTRHDRPGGGRRGAGASRRWDCACSLRSWRWTSRCSGLRVFAVVDAGRAAAPIAVAALVVLTVVPHAAAGYLAVRSYTVLDRVFANEEPRDVLASSGIFLLDKPEPDAPIPVGRPLVASPQVLTTATAEHPWTTILLLGTDEGPGNWGARTDTIILVAFEHGTRRAAAFGIPRNLINVRVGGGLPVFHEPINGLYSYVRAQPDLFADARDPGASALKQAVSQLLGVRVDYYALANLRGFADLVDALGGVTIHVKERLHDSVTRPAWGEPKPRIDVYPGRTYHFGGREALAYVRSRKDSDDYTRMARQRCFLSALTDQLDPLRVLRNFESLAQTVEHNVRTDVPLDRLPRLVKLATSVDPRSTLTVTFGREYIARRRKTDNYPRPGRREHPCDRARDAPSSARGDRSTGAPPWRAPPADGAHDARNALRAAETVLKPVCKRSLVSWVNDRDSRSRNQTPRGGSNVRVSQGRQAKHSRNRGRDSFPGDPGRCVRRDGGTTTRADLKGAGYCRQYDGGAGSAVGKVQITTTAATSEGFHPVKVDVKIRGGQLPPGSYDVWLVSLYRDDAGTVVGCAASPVSRRSDRQGRRRRRLPRIRRSLHGSVRAPGLRRSGLGPGIRAPSPRSASTSRSAHRQFLGGESVPPRLARTSRGGAADRGGPSLSALESPPGPVVRSLALWQG